jgi:lipopolysaccharide biosynthesis protein
VSLIGDFRRNVQPGPFYEDDSVSFHFEGDPVRVIAYYLPQFHPTPENDLWWGKGFTDWTNVTKSLPRFRGHYQPHLPGELGFYDLRNPEILYRQAMLARRYGVYGFCIHHYWFAGRTLLDSPLRNLLANRDIDIRFCLNWANENWTRTWDGSNKKILIAQKYSPEDDLAFAASLESALTDRRYVRVNGRPLLMIYRPSLFPNIRRTVDRWRDHFVRAGYGNPLLVMPEGYGHDPAQFGMDACAGFPPHAFGFNARHHILAYLVKLEHPTYSACVRSYDAMMLRGVSNMNHARLSPPQLPFFPGVCPSWDNSARRENGGHVFIGSTPQKYGSWLRSACEFVIDRNPQDERIVFVNAWNEWAEGAHLEPDRHYGYAYLAETGRVLSSIASELSRSELVSATK